MLVKLSDSLYVKPEQVSKILITGYYDEDIFILMENGDKHRLKVLDSKNKYESLDKLAAIINGTEQ